MLGGATIVAATPTSTFLPAARHAAIPVDDSGALGTVDAVYAKTHAADLRPGRLRTSDSAAGTANVKLLGTAVTGVTRSQLMPCRPSCTAAGNDADGERHRRRISKLSGNPMINLTRPAADWSSRIPSLLTVLIGEQIHDADGMLTVNALHMTSCLGTAAWPTSSSARSTCGPNAAVLPVAAFSFQDLPVILAGIALLVAAGFGIRVGARRLRSAA